MIKGISRARGLIVIAALTAVPAFASQQTLVPPPGYLQPVGHDRSKAFACEPPPPPFTERLDFPSKYQGSGAARDEVNPEAERAYRKQTKAITQMEKGINTLVIKYTKSGQPEILKCAVDWLTAWSDAHALENEALTHTGKSMRKWSLASISGAYIRLKFSSSSPLAAYPEQARRIEHWLGAVADRVVPEWDLHARKINNHYYWAAWAVMATAVDLNRRDLFDWAVSVYGIFAQQATPEGYLPEELARDTRALAYHNYALTPLAMIAAFGKANGVDLADEGHGALNRVATRTLDGLSNPSIFERKVGVRQDVKDATGSSKLAWLEPYCWTVQCSAAVLEELRANRPAVNDRLGGDLTAVFSSTR